VLHAVGIEAGVVGRAEVLEDDRARRFHVDRVEEVHLEGLGGDRRRRTGAADADAVQSSCTLGSVIAGLHTSPDGARGPAHDNGFKA